MKAPADPLIDDRAVRSALLWWFGLSPGAAGLLAELYRREGVAISSRILADIIGSSVRGVSVQIHGLRQALDSEAIDHMPSAGYRLTDEGLSEVRAAIWQMGEELRRAS